MRVVDYRCGHEPAVVKAPLSQMYTLYAVPHRRIESTTVVAGQPVGFMRNGPALQAVAGDQRIPLPDGNYVWVVEFHPEPPLDPAVAALGTAAVLAVFIPLEYVYGLAQHNETPRWLP